MPPTPRCHSVIAPVAVDAPSNASIGGLLRQVATTLEEQGADRFRVGAWRRAAETVESHAEPLTSLFARGGVSALDEIPTIGPVIARAIEMLLLTGHLPMLDRLRGEAQPSSLLATVAGIGPRLGRRLERELGIQTLEELELAAHDGRLARLRGFGPKRIHGIQETLAARLRRPNPHRSTESSEPPVSDLLDVDREYRERAAADALTRIAPRRFNPSHEAWLPILHTKRGDRDYTALFSNTAQAHRLGKTHDWVVIYADGRNGQRQYTVVTLTRGRKLGSRAVRGREADGLISANAAVGRSS
jgi:DNA polymerase (family X)